MVLLESINCILPTVSCRENKPTKGTGLRIHALVLLYVNNVLNKNKMKSLPFARSDAKHSLNIQTSFPNHFSPFAYRIKHSTHFLYKPESPLFISLSLLSRPRYSKTRRLRTCLKQVLIN